MATEVQSWFGINRSWMRKGDQILILPPGSGGRIVSFENPFIKEITAPEFSPVGTSKAFTAEMTGLLAELDPDLAFLRQTLAVSPETNHTEIKQRLEKIWQQAKTKGRSLMVASCFGEGWGATERLQGLAAKGFCFFGPTQIRSDEDLRVAWEGEKDEKYWQFGPENCVQEKEEARKTKPWLEKGIKGCLKEGVLGLIVSEAPFDYGRKAEDQFFARVTHRVWHPGLLQMDKRQDLEEGLRVEGMLGTLDTRQIEPGGKGYARFFRLEVVSPGLAGLFLGKDLVNWPALTEIAPATQEGRLDGIAVAYSTSGLWLMTGERNLPSFIPLEIVTSKRLESVLSQALARVISDSLKAELVHAYMEIQESLFNHDTLELIGGFYDPNQKSSSSLDKVGYMYVYGSC